VEVKKKTRGRKKKDTEDEVLKDEDGNIIQPDPAVLEEKKRAEEERTAKLEVFI
jgi:hypothetical protein